MDPQDNAPEGLRTLPLIPLRDLIVFPATLVPFIIGRASSIQALDKSAETDRLIVLAAQMDPTLDNPEPKDIYTMGVTAKVIRTVPVDEKNVRVIVEGKRRVRILEYAAAAPFYQVLVKYVRVFEDDSKEGPEELKKALLPLVDKLIDIRDTKAA